MRFAGRTEAGTRSIIILAVLFSIGVLPADRVFGQSLRFVAGDREIPPPANASFRIGPFYSNFRFTQTIGVRYSDGTINQTNELALDRRSVIRENGFEIPLVTTAYLMNYVPINRHMDLDASLWCSYAYYPLRTADDSFQANFRDPEFLADIGTSVEVPLSAIHNMRVMIYDRPAYLVSYVNRRGEADDYGGVRYNRFENEAGLNVEWMLASDINILGKARRQDVFSPSKAFEDQEQTAHSGELSVECRVSPIVVAGIGAGGSVTDYKIASRGGYNGFGGNAFCRIDLSQDTKVSASVGYSSANMKGTNGETTVESGTIVGAVAIEGALYRDIKHSLSYSKTQKPGFYNGIEQYDTVKYSLNWGHDDVSVGFSAAYNNSSILNETGKSESDSWNTQVNVSKSLTKSTSVGFNSSYEVINNNWGINVDANQVPELAYDYSTWVNRLELKYSMAANFGITAYVGHVIRASSVDVLQYKRITAGIDCCYTYEY